MDGFYGPENRVGNARGSCSEAQDPLKERILVFDTTLRDGEQAAGCRLDPGQKLEIARQLVKLGVDVMEVGFPQSSPRDFESVSEISREIEGPTICALSRALPSDVETCGQALRHAGKARIHTGLGVSDIHIMGKFKDPKYGANLDEKREHALEMSIEAVEIAKSYTQDVEFYAEDAARADREYLQEVIASVTKAGATVVNIPDTTGYSVPEQFGGLVKEVKASMPNMDRALLSVHCHNDLGLAVSNTLAGIANGAQQVEVTINGIGERAGNAALEEVVMALRTRKDYFSIDTGIDTTEIYHTSHLVARAFGHQIPYNKPIVGFNAFAHSAGIHVDGFLKDRRTYEIMQPEQVGYPRSRIVLTARSGRHAVKNRLKELGYTLTAERLDAAYQRFIDIADKVTEVSDHALMAIVNGEPRAPKTFEMIELEFTGGLGQVAVANVTVNARGTILSAQSKGDGPVDATYKAISKAIGIPLALVEFSINTTGEGTDALGEATVKVKDHATAIGHGASTDIVLASALAYMDALSVIAETQDTAAHGKTWGDT